MKEIVTPFDEIASCRYAVIGDPVKHSRSPEMQNAGFAALGLADRYGKVAVAAAELPAFAAWARRHLAGFNITVPHKENIIPLLDEIDQVARLAGSVNTVKIDGGRLAGCSTDGYGVEMAVGEAFGLKLAGLAVLFIGAGGAARAVAFHLAASGARSLTFANRTLSRAVELGDRIRTAYPGVATAAVKPDDAIGLRRLLLDADLVIQAGSLGLKADDPPPFDLELLAANPRLCCFESIYRRTPFLVRAAEFGMRTADGRGMLLHQGVKSFEIWTGRKAPVEIMRQALERSLAC